MAHLSICSNFLQTSAVTNPLVCVSSVFFSVCKSHPLQNRGPADFFNNILPFRPGKNLGEESSLGGSSHLVSGFSNPHLYPFISHLWPVGRETTPLIGDLPWLFTTYVRHLQEYRDASCEPMSGDSVVRCFLLSLQIKTTGRLYVAGRKMDPDFSDVFPTCFFLKGGFAINYCCLLVLPHVYMVILVTYVLT